MAIAQDARPTVAILDFEGQDISVQEVQTLTERMRSEIGATNAVRLIERKAIENIMAEQVRPVSTGVYFSILTDGQQVQIRKMLLLK